LTLITHQKWGSRPVRAKAVDYRRVVSWLRHHRETIGLWLLALAFAAACLALGRWQLDRYQDKRDRSQLVERNYDAAPVPLNELMPAPSARFDERLQWRQVRVTGRYDPAATVLVRNRPRTGDQAKAQYGYEVVVPLRLDDGSALLVDRGWLPNGTLGRSPGRAPDTVPAPPAGEVTVTARLRRSEPARSGALPQGQAGSISVSSIGARVGYPLYPAYGVLVSEQPPAAVTPAPLDPPVTAAGQGINASYAAQWLLFALLGLGFPTWVARRRRQIALEDAGGKRAAGAEQLGAEHGERVDVRPLEPARARRRRIWDADDE
jgi:cytochrome oxidase assembly protein ShyY1